MDLERVKQLASTSETASSLLKSFAGRQRIRASTDLRRYRQRMVHEGVPMDSKDYKQFWEALQRAGIGQIIYGTRGAPNRFEWRYSMREVGKIGLMAAALPPPAPEPAAPAPSPITPEEAMELARLLRKVLGHGSV